MVERERPTYVYYQSFISTWDRGSTVVKVLCYKSEGRWFDPSWCQWIFHWNKILPIAKSEGRWFDPSWCQWIFHWHKILPIALWPWGKGGRCVRLTVLPPSCAVVMKSGNINFLEPFGPLRACNRTALPFISTCFGHYYAHRQENKTVCCVVWSWDATTTASTTSAEHHNLTMGIIMPETC